MYNSRRDSSSNGTRSRLNSKTYLANGPAAFQSHSSNKSSFLDQIELSGVGYMNHTNQQQNGASRPTSSISNVGSYSHQNTGTNLITNTNGSTANMHNGNPIGFEDSSLGFTRKMSLSQTNGFRKIYIQVENTGKLETIVLPEQASNEEVYNAISAAADIPFQGQKSFVIKLTDKDGAILPIGSYLPSNSSDNPYHLMVKNTQPLNGGMALQSQLNTATNNGNTNQPNPASSIGNSSGLIHSPSGTLKTNRDIVEALQNSKDNKFEPVKMSKLLHQSTFPKQMYATDEAIFEAIKQPEFDIWKVDDNHMLLLFEHMFEDLGLTKEYNIDGPTLKRFLLVCKHNYNQNPFHNFRHAFCVSQMMYSIIYTTGIVDKLPVIDRLILLLSCLGHDLDHPGYNNAYQVNALTDLAIIYNDSSPLENHHAAVLFYILKQPETNVLANVPDSVYRSIRKSIIQCILATDMAKHKDILTTFGAQIDNFDWLNADHRALLLQMIIKCSDISNEVRPAEVAEPWVDFLLQEFFAQSDAEKKAGLPVAPFMDRDKVTKPNAQIGFIQFVLLPLFETLAKLLPIIEERYVSYIRTSLNYYKKMNEAPKPSTESK